MRPETPWLAALLAALLAVLFSAPAAADPASDPLRIVGSTTLFPIAEIWVEHYRDRHPDTPVEAEAGGTTAGLAALLDGTADLALASRPLSAGEEARALELGLRLEKIEVARDALSVIVHRDNPIATLTAGQLRGLFTGELADWAEVGGLARPVRVIARNPESHTGKFFRQQILEGRPFAAASEMVSTRAEMIARIAAEPSAIGFAGLADALNSGQRERVKPVKLVLDFADPAAQSRDGSQRQAFAISRPLFFFARAPLSAEVREFVSFVLGPEGQALIVASNFFPVRPTADPGDG